ncbi:hypothetical protein DCS_04145 [Drechmeria coniospora]|uniref:Uncharacterized protein n=1 Tax=Drechmeria coniospora TaxID=98403 RepID=A0A151GJ77_DRECN|nr:hypothetical protein DCS_04145 [Drechmeria coniospora]KYK57138.1 hypothetical protein DCS_04145 [Drechmeria coniospora]
MCGSESDHRPRGGALVALRPPTTTGRSSPTALADGDLSFHTPGRPRCAVATHARLSSPDIGDVGMLGDFEVVIHPSQLDSPAVWNPTQAPTDRVAANEDDSASDSGDLTRCARDCGQFRRFALPGVEMVRGTGFVELPLEKPLSLEVGGGGIIGRRVSLYARPPREREYLFIAEGIVGFNHLGVSS